MSPAGSEVSREGSTPKQKENKHQPSLKKKGETRATPSYVPANLKFASSSYNERIGQDINPTSKVGIISSTSVNADHRTREINHFDKEEERLFFNLPGGHGNFAAFTMNLPGFGYGPGYEAMMNTLLQYGGGVANAGANASQNVLAAMPSYVFNPYLYSQQQVPMIGGVNPQMALLQQQSASCQVPNHDFHLMPISYNMQAPVNLGPSMGGYGVGGNPPRAFPVVEMTSTSVHEDELKMRSSLASSSMTSSTRKTTVDNRKVVAVKTNRSSTRPSSRYRGVYWNRNCKAWRARIWVNGKSEHLGNFDIETDAARAFDRRARELNRSQLNFPDESTTRTELYSVKRKRNAKRAYIAQGEDDSSSIKGAAKIDERVEHDGTNPTKTDIQPPTPPAIASRPEQHEYKDDDDDDDESSVSKKAKAV